MTTKEKIKTLMADFCGLSFALGYATNTKDFNSDVFAAISNARTDLEEVIFALCDELPDHIADPGKKVIVPNPIELGLQDPEHIAALGKMMYGGQPVNLCAKEETK